MKIINSVIKIVPVFTTALLMSCSENPKESENNIVNEDTIEKKENLEHQSENKVKEVVVKKNDLVEVNNIETESTGIGEELIKEDANQDKTQVIKEEKVVLETTFNHSTWDELLKKNVSSDGKVNYKGFKSDKAQLESYLNLLKSNSPKEEWSKNQKLAYWINVYNAFTVKLIVDNYPLKSIMDLDKPWDKKWINIDGKSYSLGNVENDVLRKMGESRIHFAINCASFSCPNLLNEAYTADQLNSQLRKVTKDFFEDETKNDLTDGDLKVSKLFEWYADDFANGDIVKYINKYSGKSVSSDSKISYLEYSWKLNE